MSIEIADTVEVLIIGGGPVGLASAFQLGRAGVKTLLLERRASFSRHSKAAGIHARTMEIYRQWGFADEVREQGGGSGVFAAGWMTRLAGIELGVITLGADQAERDRFFRWSPELMALCGQDVYEPILAEHVRQFPSVEIRLDAEAGSIEQDDAGVTVEYQTGGTGETRRVRAQYVIAADGVRSPSRKRLGITESAVPSFGNSINVLFEAPLEPYRNGRRYGLFWVVNGDTQGALSWKRRGDLWSYNFEAADDEDPAIYTPDRCAALIRKAVGDDNLDVKVISILHWQHDQAVTDTWRQGRVFIAGDASHRFPPHGGFGMNSGVQDSQNLAWKLIARLRWGAGDRLLDSYQPERKPVAENNGEQCLINTKRMEETGWLLKDTRALAAIEEPEGAPLRDKIASAIPKQREQFFSQGQQFGQIYVSDAVLPDGKPAEPSTVSQYVPTGSPGARAPHVWLDDGKGGRISLLDLYDGGFTLLVPEQGGAWIEAARRIVDTSAVPISTFQIGGQGHAQVDDNAPWAEIVGVGTQGALLVRPDNHVGARWSTLPEDPEVALAEALEQILDARLPAAKAGLDSVNA